MSLKATHARPLATLTVRNSKLTQRHKEEKPAPTFPTFAHSRFIQICKKTAIFFLKFLIVLLLMSPHGHASDQDMKSSREIHPSTKISISTDSFGTQSECSLSNVQASLILSPNLLFLLAHVRMKDHASRSVARAVLLHDFHHKMQPG